MNCAWKELLSILPIHLRQEVDRLGKTSAQEIRLRLQSLPVLVLPGRTLTFGKAVSGEDLHFVVNTACRYSPWTAESAACGYITAEGGHRIGICGETIEKNGVLAGYRWIRSVNIRIARDFPGIATQLAALKGNILILGRPGSGKTTLLRDLIRQRSTKENISVVDERGELFPKGIVIGKSTDILTGCSKPKGIELLLRTMNPDVIAVDEVTAAADCDALVQVGWCGVGILATLHGSGQKDLKCRRVYRPIVESGLFDTLVVMNEDKSYTVERMIL